MIEEEIEDLMFLKVHCVSRPMKSLPSIHPPEMYIFARVMKEVTETSSVTSDPAQAATQLQSNPDMDQPASHTVQYVRERTANDV